MIDFAYSHYNKVVENIIRLWWLLKVWFIDWE